MSTNPSRGNENGSEDRIAHDWDPDKALASLHSEKVLMGRDETEVTAAERMFRESLVPAVASVVHMSVYCRNERLRLDAAKYVIERNIGQLKDVIPARGGESADPLMELLTDCLVDSAQAYLAENDSGANVEASIASLTSDKSGNATNELGPVEEEDMDGGDL